MSAVPTLEAKGYYLNGNRLTSVTKVVSAVLGTSWSDIPPSRLHLVEKAAERGKQIEKYVDEWLDTGGIETRLPEHYELDPWLECFGNWYDEFKPKFISKQRTVWSEEDGTVGLLDYELEFSDALWQLDLKATAQAEKGWPLQCGGYQHMGKHSGPVGVLHINPKFSKGYILRRYENAASQWKSALNWYRTLQQLKVEDD